MVATTTLSTSLSRQSTAGGEPKVCSVSLGTRRRQNNFFTFFSKPICNLNRTISMSLLCRPPGGSGLGEGPVEGGEAGGQAQHQHHRQEGGTGHQVHQVLGGGTMGQQVK